MTDIQRTILYVIYEAFGGACSLRQALLLDEVTQTDIDELVEGEYLRVKDIDGEKFIICRHSVYTMAGNSNQNYRLTTYNLKKSCLLAEFWLVKQGVHSVRAVAKVLTQGTMHQQSLGPWEDYLAALHAQGCYEWLTIPEEQERYMVLFPKSNDPLTISKAIKKFFDNEALLPDYDKLEPHLAVCVPNERIREAVLKRIDARYWWIGETLDIFPLECPDTKDLI